MPRGPTATGCVIAKQLVAGDPSNTQWQRDLAVPYDRLGDVAVAQGKLVDAARAYSDGLLIAKKLVAGDPSNTDWQRDLTVSYIKLGDVAVARGKLDDARAGLQRQAGDCEPVGGGRPEQYPMAARPVGFLRTPRQRGGGARRRAGAGGVPAGSRFGRRWPPATQRMHNGRRTWRRRTPRSAHWRTARAWRLAVTT